MSLKFVLYALSIPALALLCFSGCTDPLTGQTTVNSQIGGKLPVVASSLVGQSSSQRTGKHDYQFKWNFDEGNFKITGQSIPEDLLNDLCNSKPAEEITGTWKIEHDNIVLTSNVNGETIRCEMEIFTTGPIRIQSSAAQYVF